MWAIISKLLIRLRKAEGSIQLKIALSYVALLLVVVVIMNTYPIITAQNMVFQSERTILLNQANLISSSLSAMNYLQTESAEMVMELMGNTGVNQVLVTDSDMEIIYNSDTQGDPANIDRDAIQTALNGQDVFHSAFRENVFISTAAVPVMTSQAIIGCVFIFDRDIQQGSIIVNIQNNLKLVSLIVCIIAISISLFFSSYFARRAGVILRSITLTRKGDYSHRISIRGSDEFAQLADEFNALTERLQNTEEERRQFVADASHELRTPLASIKLLTDSIMNTPGMDEGLIMEFVGDIGSQADRLSRLSEKLLTLSRIDEQGKGQGTAVDCSKVVTVVVRDLSLLAQTNEIKIVANIQQECYIYCNEDELYQIAYNLVENAIKYNQTGGTVFVTVEPEGSRIRLCVEDTGPGIPTEDLDKIFDRFYRVDKARSREKGGSGIGLSIVSEGVKRYGGQIKAESGPGMGARFTALFLPPKATVNSPDEMNSNNGGSDLEKVSH